MSATLPAIDATRRQDLVQLGLWMFLATVTMLFAAFTSAYMVRRTGADWRPIELPSLLRLNTAILLASSFTIEMARAKARRRQWRFASRALSATMVLGLAFLAGQIRAWRLLLAAGVFLPSSPHAAFFYILTGAHGLHLAAGLVLLSCAVVRARRESLNVAPLPPPSVKGIAPCVTFWHFLGALWLYVFILLSAS
jgi:cytochrome c oxidase subunit 3